MSLSVKKFRSVDEITIKNKMPVQKDVGKENNKDELLNDFMSLDNLDVRALQEERSGKRSNLRENENDIESINYALIDQDNNYDDNEENYNDNFAADLDMDRQQEEEYRREDEEDIARDNAEQDYDSEMDNLFGESE